MLKINGIIWEFDEFFSHELRIDRKKYNLPVPPLFENAKPKKPRIKVEYIHELNTRENTINMYVISLLKQFYSFELQGDYIPYQRADKINDRYLPLKFTLPDSYRCMTKHKVKEKIQLNLNKDTIYVFPDNGAKERYLTHPEQSIAIGSKKRIDGVLQDKYELTPLDLTKNKIIVIDDICSGGKTFELVYNAIVEQRERKNINVKLKVTYMEADAWNRNKGKNPLSNIYKLYNIIEYDKLI